MRRLTHREKETIMNTTQITKILSLIEDGATIKMAVGDGAVVISAAVGGNVTFVWSQPGKLGYSKCYSRQCGIAQLSLLSGD